jgi:hypothetical protein
MERNAGGRAVAEPRSRLGAAFGGALARLRTAPLLPWRLSRGEWAHIAAVFAVSRLAVIAVAVLGTFLFPEVGPQLTLAVHPIGTPGGGDWARLFDHFDTGFYLGISHHYATPADGWPGWLSEWAFFPLYPMTLHQVSLGLGLLQVPSDRDLIAAVLVSHAALLAALIYLYRLVAADISATTARLTVLFMVLFPASVFFSVAYPESLFLFTCVASFYHARRRQWALAGALCAAALLTRPQGLFLLAPLAVEFASFLAERRDGLPRRAAQGLWLGLPLVALAGYALYSRAITGFWLAFSVSATQAWGHRTTPPIYPLLHYLVAPTFGGFLQYDFEPINFLLAVLFLALAVLAWRRLPPSYAIWLLIAVLFPLSTNGHALFSFARYVSTAFPAFVALAAWSVGERSPSLSNDGASTLARTYFPPLWVRTPLVLAVSVPLLALYVVLWVNGYPAAI